LLPEILDIGGGTLNLKAFENLPFAIKSAIMYIYIFNLEFNALITGAQLLNSFVI